MDIFHRYTPMVEPLSLDEAFLDTTGCERLFGDSIEIGRRIKQDILRETGLVVSVGIAPSKFLAKLGVRLGQAQWLSRDSRTRDSDRPRPAGPSKRSLGLGQRTALRLKALGVETVGDLAARDREDVSREFGASGAWIYDLAHGEDPRRVTPRREEKSHGMERTFPEDISDREKLRLLLFEFCEEVSYARSDSAMNASPGGIMNAFCEPDTTTSRPQASTGSSYTPTAVMASTTISRSSRSRTISAISRIG